MTIWGVLFLCLILGGACWLSWALYGRADVPTHCIGCGRCAADGECYLVKEAAERKRKKQKKA